MVVNALLIVTRTSLRGDHLLPPSSVPEFTPGPRSPTGSWFLDARIANYRYRLYLIMAVKDLIVV